MREKTSVEELRFRSLYMGLTQSLYNGTDRHWVIRANVSGTQTKIGTSSRGLM